MDKWKAELLVKMRIYRITQKKLAEHLGITPQYVNMVFSGSKSPKTAERNFTEAVDNIIREVELEEKSAYPPERPERR